MYYESDPYPEWLPPHKCNLWSYCDLDNDYRLLFCTICHKVIGFEHEGKRVLKTAVLDEEHRIYKENEYSEDTIQENK